MAQKALNLIMLLSQSKIRRLLKEIDSLIAPISSHGRDSDKSPGLDSLARAVNRLADLCEKSRDSEKKPEVNPTARTEDEKRMLAAFIAELPEGVLICNRKGKIVLYNRRAKKMLETDENRFFLDASAKGTISGLGGSISTLMDKSLVEHALEEINERLKRNIVNAISHFVIKGQKGHVLQARMVPILNQRARFNGFTVIVKDITLQHEADKRVDGLLQLLTKNARSPLASIRAANEAMLEFEDMDSLRQTQFKKIIQKESIILSDILNTVAGDYAALVQVKRSLVSVSGSKLVETIVRRAFDKLGIVIYFQVPPDDVSLKADRFSFVSAVLFVLNQLKNQTGIWDFYCRLLAEKKFVNLEMTWQGDPIGAETLRQWEDQYLIIEDEEHPLTLKEVLSHHQAALWSDAIDPDEGDAMIRFLLPVDDTEKQHPIKPVVILPESRLNFYNLDLFNQSDRESELDNRLLTELSYTALIREISQADKIEAIMGKQSQLPRLIHAMITGGTKIRTVTWLITTFADAILNRILEFALDAMGPPPVPFAFIIMGSEGRKEQTLKTDQDNAIIFEDPDPESGITEKDAQDYFLALAEKVCTWLDRAGYDFCQGGIMAKNPKWCRPLSTWKHYFTTWVQSAEPRDLLHTTIFFDFRFAYGDREIVNRLSSHLQDSLEGWSGFFRYMSENAVYFKPPIGFFGRLFVKSKGKHRNRMDIKSAMTPIVDFARIYALNNGIKETNTQDRLYQLYMRKILSRKEYNEIEQAYGFMMQIRFMRQVEALLGEKVKPDNYINPKELSTIEKKMLKAVLKKIGTIQTRLSFTFLGASDSQIG